MLLGPSVPCAGSALVRCTVRTNASHVSVIIATVDQGPNIYVATNTPYVSSMFVNQYKRLSVFCLPGKNPFQPAIQVLNTSTSEPLIVTLDNMEIIPINPERYYSGKYLDGDEDDPAITSLSGGNTVYLTLPNGAKPLEMVLIPEGTFMMGDDPIHQVTLTNAFYMGKYEVTQAQWQAVMGSNPSFLSGSDLPVEQVSWDDCRTFIQKLNQLGQGIFRLPTEAEWEYACRAGTTTPFYWGENNFYNSEIEQYAWYNKNSGSGTHGVGRKLPNKWGLYDMSGNVCEWCQDWYGSYSRDIQIDPLGAVSGSYRVYRGGSWNDSDRECYSTYRLYMDPGIASTRIGVRLVMVRS